MTREIELQLFGAFRECDGAGRVRLQVPVPATAADLRRALAQHGERHWPAFRPALLVASAFASASEVLRDGDELPANETEFAVLPPVSGG